MKLALAQMNIKWEDKRENLKLLTDILEAVKDKKIGLLLCPEMSFTGFSMNTAITAESREKTVDTVRKLARDYGLAIGFGWVKAQDTHVPDGEGLCENHYTIVSPENEILSDYIKIHPFSFSGEHKFFKGGSHLSLCNIEDFCVGTAICYDLRFPEIYQSMSKHAELIIQPANWPAKRAKAWSTLLAARAIENQCYMAGINCVGNINETVYGGDSAIYSPEGEKITPQAAVEIQDSTVFIYEIKNDVAKIRAKFPVKSDRREDLYGRLLHKTDKR